jgi:hypothetical protein
LADVREVARIRGFEGLRGIDTLLSVEPGRVPLTHVSPAVLAALPGLDSEGAARLTEMRLRGERVAEMPAFTGRLSPAGRDRVMRRFPDLVEVVATEPDAWILTSRATVGSPPAGSVVEVRLVRAGNRAAISRRRTWTD